MKWAALILVAFFALCTPRVLNAQDDAFTAAAEEKLQGFGLDLRQRCFSELRLSQRISIAVDQSSTWATTYFSKERTEDIIDTITRILGNDDRSFQVTANGEGASWKEKMTVLAPPGVPPRERPHAVITIVPGRDPNGRSFVKVVAYTPDGKCQHAAAPITVSDSSSVSVDPNAPPDFFEDVPGDDLLKIPDADKDTGRPSVSAGSSTLNIVQPDQPRQRPAPPPNFQPPPLRFPKWN